MTVALENVKNTYFDQEMAETDESEVVHDVSTGAILRGFRWDLTFLLVWKACQTKSAISGELWLEKKWMLILIWFWEHTLLILSETQRNFFSQVLCTFCFVTQRPRSHVAGMQKSGPKTATDPWGFSGCRCIQGHLHQTVCTSFDWCASFKVDCFEMDVPHRTFIESIRQDHFRWAVSAWD